MTRAWFMAAITSAVIGANCVSTASASDTSSFNSSGVLQRRPTTAQPNGASTAVSVSSDSKV